MITLTCLLIVPVVLALTHAAVAVLRAAVGASWDWVTR